MTKKDQRRIVRELLDSARKTMLESIVKMPKEWDGHEIRAYASDLFKMQRSGLMISGHPLANRIADTLYLNRAFRAHLGDYDEHTT